VCVLRATAFQPKDGKPKRKVLHIEQAFRFPAKDHENGKLPQHMGAARLGARPLAVLTDVSRARAGELCFPNNADVDHECNW
jgi:hypothetical protein